jgi:putative transposase
MSDHVYMMIRILPKHLVASVIGAPLGEERDSPAAPGAAAGLQRRKFWARGYAVSTVGFNEEQIRRYIREQEGSDGGGLF